MYIMILNSFVRWVNHHIVICYLKNDYSLFQSTTIFPGFATLIHMTYNNLKIKEAINCQQHNDIVNS